MDCIFCNIEKDRMVIENETAYAIYDGFPVSKGHMLIIPKKHFKDYFEVDQQTRDELWKLVDECKRIVDKKFKPDGYNIGINCGEAAGQTVMHLHIHLIPRYKGDIENPKGGVRGVIPNKRIY
ncbi:MAG: HIT family protein [Sedimentibacter saalensis]|uniref:HIT family protein n=1 Tax=Sedimentibacter saalensis TaxID=130788 RepID=UPI002B1ED942|nr:HIT family protein [Sedimentibacter saalensis]MEA5095679.1 HIT family protein [Sedimentibacter saalensis]